MSARRGLALASLLLLLLLAACKRSGGGGAAAGLRFERASGKVVTLSTAEMQRITPARDITVFDPNYKRDKRYRAHLLAPLVARGLGLDDKALRAARFLFIASDGYKVALAGVDIVALEAYLAVADLAPGGWKDVPGHNGVKPGPLYVVWRGEKARDMKLFPWPWQLATVRPSPKDLYARTVPLSAPAGSPARAGHKIFLRDCIRCHAINRQGGRLGPELNVPKNVLEYRDEKLLREFIRNPKAYRYGNMPAQTQLSDGDLDSVVAYLRVMVRHKHDSEAAKAKAGAKAKAPR